jgi:hypothetical protein
MIDPDPDSDPDSDLDETLKPKRVEGSTALFRFSVRTLKHRRDRFPVPVSRLAAEALF